MKQRMLMLAFVAGLLVAPAAVAAPAPSDVKTNAGPTVALQVKSIDELLTTAKAAAKNFLPDAMYKEFEKEVLGKLDLNIIKGIDTKRPAGLYATLGDGILQGDISKSSLVAIIPVTDEKQFVELLGKLELRIDKRDDYYSIPIPNAPIAASMRFIKGHAYIGVAGDRLDPKLLLDPKEVIDAKEAAAAMLRIRVDRIPEELKSQAIAFLSGLADEAKNDPGIVPELKPIVADIFTTGLRWLKLGSAECKEVVYRIDLDPKSGALISEWTLEAKSGSSLARSFAGVKPTKNDFAGIIGSDSAAHAVVQVPLFIEDVQSILVKLIDAGSDSALKNSGNAPKEARELMTEFFATLKRTVKDGNLDAAASLRGPNKNDQYTAVGAVSLKETAPLEKAIKTALTVAPKDVNQKLKIDSYKVGAVNVHEILVGDELPKEPAQVFTKSNVHVALAGNAVFATFGANAKEVMTEVLTAKLSPKPMPLIQAEVSGKRMQAFIKNAGAPDEAMRYLEKFLSMDRIGVLTVKLEGGDKLVVRQETGLLPLMGVFWTVGASAKAEFQQVAPAIKVEVEKKK